MLSDWPADPPPVAHLLSDKQAKYLILFLLWMGQACTNPLEYLITEYGADVTQFIVIEKTTELIDEKFPAVKEELQTKTGEFSKEIMANVDTEAANGKTTITSEVDSLKDRQKDKISAFEKISGTSVDDMIGINKVD